MFGRMALRDLSIIALALGLWWLLAGYSAGEGALADLTGIVTGTLVGVGAYFVHEWGHLAGALATGSKVEPATSLKSGFLFSFDSKANDRRQFLAMSFSGFAATGLVVWAFYGFLPDEYLATRVARGFAMVGVFLLFTIELPLVGWALLGNGLPPVESPSHKAAQKAARQAGTRTAPVEAP